MAGIYYIISNFIENNLEYSITVLDYLALLSYKTEICNLYIGYAGSGALSITTLSYNGPHLSPKFLTEAVRTYYPNLNRNLIGVQNRKRTIIYQWINL